VHSWWLNEDEKISKSRGNVIEPNFLIDRFGVDGLRYFLCREAPLETDSNYSYATILRRVNSDLANDLGNLVSRALTMVQRYCHGKIPSAQSIDTPLRASLERIVAALPETVGEFAFPRLLSEIWEVVNGTNRYIVEQEPWKLAKDSASKEKLDGVLYNTCEAIRIIAGLIAPVAPDSAGRIWKQLGLQQEPSSAILRDLQWGGLKSGVTLGELSALFPRIEEKEGPAPTDISEVTPPESQHVSIEEFQKLGLKVGEVKTAEKIQGSKKLLKLTVDLGTEVRTLVAGIAEAYAAEELVGRQVIVVTNLKPTRFMGVESNGMILAASVNGKPVLASITAPVPNGTAVK